MERSHTTPERTRGSSASNDNVVVPRDASNTTLDGIPAALTKLSVSIRTIVGINTGTTTFWK
jgi:hypothetical protein